MIEKIRLNRKALSIFISFLIVLLTFVFTCFSAIADENDDLNNTQLDTPVITSVSCVSTGAKISWGKVNGATNYRVFYKNNEGNWARIGNTTESSFVWTGAKSGNDYTFTVRCFNDDGEYVSSFDSVGKTLSYIAAPKISSVSCAPTGAKISWGKVNGATNYRVFYKNSAGNWARIGNTTETSFIWTGAKSGNDYTFTVRCFNDNDEYVSSFDSVGKTLSYIAAPKISSVSCVSTGAKISWGKVNGATNYRVFYKNSAGNWARIGNTTETSFVWTGAKSGNDYTFTVRCFNDNDEYVSSYDNVGKTLSYIAAPKISSLSMNGSTIQINWGAVGGAKKYGVFYKVNGESNWHKLDSTTSTSYTWKNAKSATRYSFTIRCLSADGNSFISSFDNVGKSIGNLVTPKLTSVSNGPYGIQITWGAVAGAEKYRVYYKTGSGAWNKLADTTAATYAWLGPVSNTNYSFTVCCLSGDGSTCISNYDPVGKSTKYIAAPKLSSVTATSKGIEIKWGKVAGAEFYRVYRKTAGGTWTAIGFTAYTDFTDMQAVKGKTYTYTVRCINKAQNAYMSGFDSVGRSATSVSNPPAKNDMVAVAEKEVGYTGGMKVWSWAGYKSRVPWCNLFVTWCANQLGYYQSGRIPLIQWPRDSVKWFMERGLYKNSSYIPKPGDLIYFVQAGETQPYHIGIVEKYENGKVYTIEGNSMDVVRKKTFDHGNKLIYGYATPDYGHN